jgi:hypothetical protein
MVNESSLARSLYTKHKIVLGNGFSFLANKDARYEIIPDERPKEDELTNFLAEHFIDYRLTDPRKRAVLTGIYFNFHLHYVARMSCDDEHIEIDYRNLATVNECSKLCQLAEMYITDGGLTFYQSSRIVGSIEKVSQAYADPYSYRKEGIVIEDGKVKSYKHYDYVIDSLTGNERKV